MLSPDNVNRSKREFGRSPPPPNTRRRVSSLPPRIEIPKNTEALFSTPLHTFSKGAPGTVYKVVNPNGRVPPGEAHRRIVDETQRRSRVRRSSLSFYLLVTGLVVFILTLVGSLLGFRLRLTRAFFGGQPPSPSPSPSPSPFASIAAP
jgi:hypothetical protein